MKLSKNIDSALYNGHENIGFKIFSSLKKPGERLGKTINQ